MIGQEPVTDLWYQAHCLSNLLNIGPALVSYRHMVDDAEEFPSEYRNHEDDSVEEMLALIIDRDNKSGNEGDVLDLWKIIRHGDNEKFAL